MGHLSLQRLHQLIKEFEFKSNTFIESGTYTGRSIIPIARNLNYNCHTIEIIKELSISTKEKAFNLNVKNINFYVGDTVKLIEGIITKIEDNIIIFLDAHSSYYESDNIDTIHSDTKRVHKGIEKRKNNYKYSCNIRKNKLSKYEVPLLEELKIISKFNKNFLIIIDDFDLFGKNIECANWTELELNKCLDLFKDKNIKYKIFKNPSQLIIHSISS